MLSIDRQEAHTKSVTAEEKLEESVRENERLREEIVGLRKELEELRKVIEEWKRGFRQRGRRFSSRPEARSDKPRKPPGRKNGHTAALRSTPEKIDATVEHAAPDTCSCGGGVHATGKSAQVIVEDLPKIEPLRTRHVAHEGQCVKCGKVQRHPLPGAPDAGRPIASVVIGSNAQALALSLRFEHHLPLRHIDELFRGYFGLSISAGGLSHMIVRTASRSQGALVQIQVHLREAPVVGGDETGFRQNGRGGYVWLLRTPQASLFHVAKRRDAETFDSLLPTGFFGVLVTDFYGVYTRREDILHGYCGVHIVREAKKILELQPGPATSAFVNDLTWIYRHGLESREQNDFVKLERTRAGFHFLATSDRYKGNDDIERLQARILKHEIGITLFLGRADIPWHNNDTERDLRPVCLQRKVVGQTRSDRGAMALGTWMSVQQTLRKNHLPFGPWFAEAAVNHRLGRPPPSLFPAA